MVYMGFSLANLHKSPFAATPTLKLVDAKRPDAFFAAANKPINPKMVAYTKRITAMAAAAAAKQTAAAATKPPMQISSPPIKLVVAA